MSSANEAVAEFHRFFDLPVRAEFTELSDDEINFRLNLITEEFVELMEAFGRPVVVSREVDEHSDSGLYAVDPDYINGYKELADLKYVIEGLDLHLGRKLDEVFAEVHRSNMSKTWNCGCGWNISHSGATYHPADCPTCGGEGVYIKRREDGKILKPSTYTPADVEYVLGVGDQS